MSLIIQILITVSVQLNKNKIIKYINKKNKLIEKLKVEVKYK